LNAVKKSAWFEKIPAFCFKFNIFSVKEKGRLQVVGYPVVIELILKFNCPEYENFPDPIQHFFITAGYIRLALAQKESKLYYHG
jgi:hypothetical protein